jgi:cytochrome c-type biogenesis protein CcmE
MLARSRPARAASPAEDRSISVKLKPAYIVGGAIILAALAFGATSFQNSLTPYVTVAEAKNARGTVQVSGLLADQGSYDQAGDFVFTMKDDKANTLKVIYKHPRPANFDQATGVVAIGRYENGVLQAESLLVKCPSKYEEQYGGTSK